jgi:hypothetical protein
MCACHLISFSLDFMIEAAIAKRRQRRITAAKPADPD